MVASARGTNIPMNTASSNRRKLIAVVRMDMAGYSRLIGLDDIGTLERLRALRREVIDPAIEKHSGRIVQTGGDSLLIAFDSIDGAVRCAVQVQQQVPSHARRSLGAIKHAGRRNLCGKAAGERIDGVVCAGTLWNSLVSGYPFGWTCKPS